MKKMILVNLVALIGLGPAFAPAQPTTGGSGFTCDTKGPQSDNDQTRRRSPETNSDVTTRSASPGDALRAGTPGTSSSLPTASEPITKADCERAHGTWEEMQMKCTRC